MKNISIKISENMEVYKNLEQKRPKLENTRNFQEHGIYESTIILPLHTGTHIDYPLHAIEGGKKSSDYNISNQIYRGYICDLSDGIKDNIISIDIVKAIPLLDIDILFFKTKKNIDDCQIGAGFNFEFPYLDDKASHFLSKSKLKFVGIDQLGIERAQPNHATHINLLKNDILIIEGLNLNDIKQGLYDFIFFTLGIQNVEAEPIVVNIANVIK